MIRAALTGSLFLASPVCLPACVQQADEVEDAVVGWVAETAVPLDGVEPGQGFRDLAPLRDLVGEARVVMLGESRHDAREHFRFKHRLIEYLVAEMGFTRFAMEESMPGAEALDAWVLGGDGDPEELLHGMGAWFIWDTEEVLALVRWMRAWNDDPAHPRKVRFHGLDITAPRGGIESLLAWGRGVDPAYFTEALAERLGLTLHDPLNWERTMAAYAALPADRLAALSQAWQSVLQRLDSLGEEGALPELEPMRRRALMGQRANELFSTGAHGSFGEAGDVRERAMSDQLLWLVSQAAPDERFVVWAHNFHVARHTLSLDIPERPPVPEARPMGQYAGEELGDRMLTIGFSFGEGDSLQGPLPGPRAGSVDDLLSQVGDPCFLVDLRLMPVSGAVHQWMTTEQVMGGEGGTATLMPARAFDSLFFVDEITPTRPTAGAQERMRSLQGR